MGTTAAAQEGRQEGRRILVLDDQQVRHDYYKIKFGGDTVHHVYTAEEAIQALRSEVFDLVHLDHDLELSVEGARRTAGGVWIPNPSAYTSNHTGYAVALGMAAAKPEDYPGGVFPRVVIHSYSVKGAIRMYRVLRASRYDVSVEPFGWQSARDFADHLLREIERGLDTKLPRPW